MSLWVRTMQMFGFNRPAPRLHDVAIERSRNVAAKADRLNETLNTYLDAQDPFRAFATDVFERGQENRLHVGPRH